MHDLQPDKRVVVTGGAGFLGRYVVRALHDRGVREVRVPRSAEYDLVTIEGVRRMYDDMRPDMVIHLAAVVGGIGANRAHPGEFFYRNLMMGVQLIEEGRRRGIEKLVAVGSVCAYPKHTPVPFREDDLWSGYPEETNAPYGLAKKMLLVQSQAYRAEYGFNSVFVLPVNLYGPGDNFDLESGHVIPALIRKCMEAVDEGRDYVVCWGTGDVSREFLFIEDAAAGIVQAADVLNESRPINLGSGHEISIRELAKKIGELTDFRGEFRWNLGRPDGQPRRCLDTSRAKTELGFAARTDLTDGLRRTISWYRSCRADDVEVCSAASW